MSSFAWLTNTSNAWLALVKHPQQHPSHLPSCPYLMREKCCFHTNWCLGESASEREGSDNGQPSQPAIALIDLLTCRINQLVKGFALFLSKIQKEWSTMKVKERPPKNSKWFRVKAAGPHNYA